MSEDKVSEDKEFGLYDELSEQDYKFAVEEAKRNLEARDDYNLVKNLEKDTMRVNGQNYCVVSWIGPTFKSKTEKYGIRIMGAFNTIKGAQKYAKKIHTKDNRYDTGIMEMNSWCLGYPDESDNIYNELGELDLVKMEIERDIKLNEFIVAHKTQIEESKQIFEMRKKNLETSKITKGIDGIAPIDEVVKGAPTQEMKDIHEKEVKKWTNEENKEIVNANDYDNDEDEDEESNGNFADLDHETNIKIQLQEYAIISYINWSGKNKKIPICIKGIYESENATNERIKELMYIDNTYDLLIVPLYKWIPCDPDLKGIKNEFKDPRLNNLIQKNDAQELETIAFHKNREKLMVDKKKDITLDTKTVSETPEILPETSENLPETLPIVVHEIPEEILHEVSEDNLPVNPVPEIVHEIV